MVNTDAFSRTDHSLNICIQALSAHPQQTNTNCSNSITDVSFYSSLSSSLTSITATTSASGVRNQVTFYIIQPFFLISSASISLILFPPLQYVKIVTLDACINLSPVLGWRAGWREGGVRYLPPRRRRFDPLLSVSEAFPCKLPLFQVRKPLISSSDCRRKILGDDRERFPWAPEILISASSTLEEKKHSGLSENFLYVGIDHQCALRVCAFNNLSWDNGG